MEVIFTLCSNNYLPYAMVLADSVRQHAPDSFFVIGLVDEVSTSVNYKLVHAEIIEAVTIEPGINHLAEKFSIVELNTCLKPAFFLYFLEVRKASKVIYLDPDISLYHPLREVDVLLQSNNIILTPHLLTPVPLDGLRPSEPLFLNYGIYNLGFLAVKKSEEVIKFLNWWKERTYELGFDKPAEGLFTDQLWMNLVPVYFNGVHILRNVGYNMAPWNLHERSLSVKDTQFFVNDEQPLVFFHFSSIVPGNDLIHREYNRFLPGSRPDLDTLYKSYRSLLVKNDYNNLKQISCVYVTIRNSILQRMKLIEEQQQQNAFNQLPYHKKMIRRLKRTIPSTVKNFLKDQ